MRRSSGLPVQPGSANRRSRRDGCTWERPTAMRASSPASCPPRPATSRGLAARAAARRRPEPPGFIRRSMPVAASPSSRSSGAAAASSAADLVVSCQRSLSAERRPAGRVLPLVARHEPGAGRGAAGAGTKAERLDLGQDAVQQPNSPAAGRSARLVRLAAATPWPQTQTAPWDRGGR